MSVAYRYDGKLCPYCGYTMMRYSPRFPTLDHVRPKRAGGTKAAWNSLIVCATCNSDKSDKMLDEFLEWLERRRDPRANHVRAALVSGVDRFTQNRSRPMQSWNPPVEMTSSGPAIAPLVRPDIPYDQVDRALKQISAGLKPYGLHLMIDVDGNYTVERHK